MSLHDGVVLRAGKEPQGSGLRPPAGGELAKCSARGEEPMTCACKASNGLHANQEEYGNRKRQKALLC